MCVSVSVIIKEELGGEEKLKADTQLHLHTPGASSRKTVMLLCPLPVLSALWPATLLNLRLDDRHRH